MKLANKIALVTGGTSGLDLATATSTASNPFVCEGGMAVEASTKRSAPTRNPLVEAVS